MRRSARFLAIFSLGISPMVIATEEPGESQAGAAENAFILGIMDVRARAGGAGSESVITQDTLSKLNLETVGVALATEEGVSLSRNARNEDIISIRGFDSRQVPVYLDGVPLYIPYDGYVDFGRFTTYDLAQIRVGKGNASLLYGPNTLGGAINLVSRQPQEAFESDLRLGAGSGDRSMAAWNLGARQGDWYAQAGLSYLDVNSFPLADGFVDRKNNPTDTGNDRENAYSNDWKLSAKIGYTPNRTDEYALGYSRQEGEKGNPVYTGESQQGIRYWQWPYWNKDSLYFLSNTALDANNRLQVRLFHDTYENRINAFADDTYTRPGQRNFFPSVYDDKNVGASVEWINQSFSGHEIHLALHHKVDRHKEIASTSPAARYRDVTQSVAIEDIIDIDAASQLRIGGSYESREGREVHEWETGSADAGNAMIEYQRNLSPQLDIFTSLAHKTRFPTIKDRYSARLGRALPNPDLRPETALHAEIGVQTSPWQGANLTVALFQSRIDDLIQNNVVISDQCGGQFCDQAQNVGEARHQGVELSVNQRWSGLGSASLAYTYLDRDNLQDSSIPLTGTPEHRLFADSRWFVTPAFTLAVTLEIESGRLVPFAGSGQSQVVDLSGFSNWGFNGTWRVSQGINLQAGIDNVADNAYELSDGIPMPGRRWYSNVTFNL
ncbi:TonB-dependent receptor plug domain-containing protein [Pseudohongiella nitratireducens]|nr:TonB-dependent receptor [Pseudohongiella nitratireducens]MDF1623423.1 TonB-dependent receptor [Pseudohongiella nitratireducens]